MSRTAFVAIQSAIVAALQAAPGLAGVQVGANRLRPIAAQTVSAVVVRLEQAEAQEMVLGVLDWSSVYTIECSARAAPGIDPAEAVDPLLSAAWETTAALQLPGLGVLQVIQQPQIRWQFDAADSPTAAATLAVTVMHRTEVPNLTPRS